MASWGRIAFVAGVSIVTFGCSETQTQDWVHLDPLHGEVFTEFDGSWEKREDLGNSRTLEFEEGVRLRQAGDVLDPRIATFDLEVEPIFTQGRSSGDLEEEDLDAIFVNLDGRASVLHGLDFPFSLDGGGGRSTGDTDGSFGSRTEFESTRFDGAVNWKSRFLPTTVSYSETTRDETFRSGVSDAVNEREDTQRRLRLSGHSSKTNLLLEREWFDDKIEGRDNDSVTDRANLDHHFRWGSGSQLSTNLDYLNRDGFIETERVGVSETATLRHGDDLTSRTFYAFNNSSAEGFDTTQHFGAFGVTHHLYENLTTALDLEASDTQTENSSERRYAGELDLDYRKRIWGDGELSLSAGGGYGMTDRFSKGGLLQVADESQTVALSGIVQLNQRFIDTGSIVVTNAAGTVVFIEGVDYIVGSAGGDFTELVILSGGQIAVGDTILATYRFEDLPSAKYYSVPYHFGAGVSFGWISLSHETSWEEQGLISGNETALSDSRESTTRAQLNWIRPRTTASAGAEWRVTRRREQDIDTFQFDQSVWHRISPELSLSARANEILSTVNESDTEFYSADLSLQWRAWPNLLVEPRAGGIYRRLETDTNGSEKRDELFVSAGLDVSWFVRRLELSLSFSHNRREADVTDITENLLFLRASRRF